MAVRFGFGMVSLDRPARSLGVRVYRKGEVRQANVAGGDEVEAWKQACVQNVKRLLGV